MLRKLFTARNAPSSMPPPSCIAMWTVWAGAFIFFYLLTLLSKKNTAIHIDAAFLCMLPAALPMVCFDFYTQWKNGKLRVQQKYDGNRLLTKVIGLYGTYGLVFIAYWLFPLYCTAFYAEILAFLRTIFPIVALLSIPYLIWAERVTDHPEDGLWHFGLLLTGRHKAADMRMVREYLMGWVVKGFFLPMMLSFMMTYLAVLNEPAFFFSIQFIGALDVFVVSVGYIMTFRVLGTHITSTDSTMTGWVVCIVCYTAVFHDNFLKYDNGGWVQWTAGNNDLRDLWGIAIFLCLFGNTVSNMHFGHRFSNLTYRGLVTHGLYRYSKHPAYIFKAINWWLLFVPFVPTEGVEMAIKHSLLFFCVCFIYFLRARTEENHCSNYPEYVAYAEWINEHGLFRHVGRWIPYLRYSRERAMRSGSRVYAPFAAREVTEQAEGRTV